MYFSTVTALAVMAVSQAVAEPINKPVRVMMSAREIFGLAARDNGGYQPSQSYCGQGATCSEACGAGYATCPSSDNAIHCYNKDAAQSCCPDNSGNSCDAGFYCAGTTGKGQTMCCPEGMDTVACAKSYGVTYAISSYPAYTPSSSSSSAYPTMSYPAGNSTSVYPTATGYPTTTYPTETKAPTTYPVGTGSSSVYPTGKPSTVPVAAGNVARPAGALVALVAVAAALL